MLVKTLGTFKLRHSSTTANITPYYVDVSLVIYCIKNEVNFLLAMYARTSLLHVWHLRAAAQRRSLREDERHCVRESLPADCPFIAARAACCVFAQLTIMGQPDAIDRYNYGSSIAAQSHTAA